MKKILSMVVFTTMILFITNAQIPEGKYVLGGNADLRFQNYENSMYFHNSFRAGVSPDIGKFVSEKLLLSGGIGYSFSKEYYNNTIDSESRLRTHSFSGSFAATWFFPVINRLYFSVRTSLNAGLAFSESYQNYDGTEFLDKSSSLFGSISAAPGLTWFMNDRWMFGVNFNALNYYFNINSGNNITSHGFNLNLPTNSFGLSAGYVFGKGK